jgi:UDPglucose 6-dehydrogenase
MRLSIFGLGKLGLCTAACFAARGHTVMGFDLNPDLMAALQARQNPLRETGLDELLSQAWPHLTVTDDIAALVTGSEVSLIIVPTPSQPDGRFSNRLVEEVLEALGPVLKKKPDFHVVDVVSTVMPGSSEGVFKPLLERLTGKKCGRDFGLVYNPEFIALGSVLHNFLNPDLVLIGASDDRSRDLVRELYLDACDNSPHIAAMSLINAEIAKLSLNAYITLKISFANELAGLCERLPGADVDVITGA